MEISLLTEVTDEIVESFAQLLPQLSSSAVIPTRAVEAWATLKSKSDRGGRHTA